MVPSYIKYVLLLQKVDAACQRHAEDCQAHFTSEGLALVQHNVAKIQGQEIHVAHIPNDGLQDSALRDPHADADVASGEPFHTRLARSMFSYKFDYNTSTDRPVDAWLYMAHKSYTKDMNMYIPMLLTVEAGLESFGANVRVVDRHDAKDMVEQVRKTVADFGRVPLVVGVAFEGKRSANQGEPILRQCVESGAYVALYNTEPTWTKFVAGVAQKIGAQEVWDYNMLNMLAYKPDGAFITRYVPPGYLTKVASKASQVNLGSSSRNESNIGFLGKLGYRSEETMDEILRQFGQRFQPTYSVWTWDDYVQWVDHYPMQLNLHRLGIGIGLETFRLSILMTFKACVVSALSDPADMQEWKGIVRFAEAVEMLDVFSDVTRTGDGVRDCQLTSSGEFQKRFHPKVILQNSGLMNEWHPVQAASAIATMNVPIEGKRCQTHVKGGSAFRRNDPSWTEITTADGKIAACAKWCEEEKTCKTFGIRWNSLPPTDGQTAYCHLCSGNNVKDSENTHWLWYGAPLLAATTVGESLLERHKSS